MKKRTRDIFIGVISFIVLALLCAGVVIGINTVPTWIEQTACKHENEETIAPVAATCTETGLKRGTKCKDCGKILVEQVELPALGHDTVTDFGTPLTCTKDGMTDGVHCVRCGEILEAQQVLTAVGHIDENADMKCETCGFYISETYLADYLNTANYTVESISAEEKMHGNVYRITFKDPEVKAFFKAETADGRYCPFYVDYTGEITHNVGYPAGGGIVTYADRENGYVYLCIPTDVKKFLGYTLNVSGMIEAGFDMVEAVSSTAIFTTSSFTDGIVIEKLVLI